VSRDRLSRRRACAALAGVGVAALAGCTNQGGSTEEDGEDSTEAGGDDSTEEPTPTPTPTEGSTDGGGGTGGTPEPY